MKTSVILELNASFRGGLPSLDAHHSGLVVITTDDQGYANVGFNVC